MPLSAYLVALEERVTVAAEGRGLPLPPGERLLPLSSKGGGPPADHLVGRHSSPERDGSLKCGGVILRVCVGEWVCGGRKATSYMWRQILAAAESTSTSQYILICLYRCAVDLPSNGHWGYTKCAVDMQRPGPYTLPSPT